MERKPKRDTHKMRRSRAVHKTLPPFNVILHNDDIHDGAEIVRLLVQIARLPEEDATKKTQQAHAEGKAVVLTTHKERAELYQEQFANCSPPVTVTVEPA